MLSAQNAKAPKAAIAKAIRKLIFIGAPFSSESSQLSRSSAGILLPWYSKSLHQIASRVGVAREQKIQCDWIFLLLVSCSQQVARPRGGFRLGPAETNFQHGGSAAEPQLAERCVID